MEHLVRAFGPRDMVDALLTALVFVGLLAIFRGTRLVPALGGLAVIVAVSFVARRLELVTVSWPFWLVVLVVLFQPELRRALAQIGRSPAFRGMLRASAEAQGHVIDDVVKAAEALAAKRMGALIVLERSMGLRHYAELGVALDARVSPDLLISLFLPYSPLHDGAVIVRDNRLAAAGCFLPLSRSTAVGRQLGTRHRAALGLAEETDAVVLAVSEESGRISLAVHGEIETPLDREALRARLGELFELGEPRAPRRVAGWAPALLGWLRK